MQQYEFKLVPLHGFRKDEDGNHEYEKYLNKMGAEGWQRKGVDLVAGDMMVIMERPVEKDEDALNEGQLGTALLHSIV